VLKFAWATRFQPPSRQAKVLSRGASSSPMAPFFGRLGSTHRPAHDEDVAVLLDEHVGPQFERRHLDGRREVLVAGGRGTVGPLDHEHVSEELLERLCVAILQDRHVLRRQLSTGRVGVGQGRSPIGPGVVGGVPAATDNEERQNQENSQEVQSLVSWRDTRVRRADPS
jgi:hypothetical protein